MEEGENNKLKSNKYINNIKQEQIGYALNIINKNWSNMSENNKNKLAEIIGGKKDKQEFITLMNNYNIN